MASFATPTDLAAYLQQSVDTGSAQLLLDLASAKIRSYCGWPISETINDTAVIGGNGSETLFLPSLHVTAITSVVAGGVTLAGTDYLWDQNGMVRFVGTPTWDYSNPAVFLPGLTTAPYSWPTSSRSITVTFTHGYATVPDEVRGVCLALAARSYQGQSASQETAGNYSVTYDVPDMTSVDRYRLIGAA